MHRHGRIKKYTTKRTMKFTEKNYKMKRNTFVFKEREVFKERRNIMNIMEKMTTNISPAYKKKEEEEYDLLPPGSSFIRDSAKMNAVRPENLDEQDEGSKVSLVVFIANFILN